MSKKKFSYKGQSIHVQWDGQLCIHVAECGHAKGELFVGGRKPWCEPDRATDDEVREVVMRCPTGSLTCQLPDGSPVEEPAARENTVHVTHNGPLYLRGELAIDSAPEDAPGLKRRAALCRCGQSKNKPFCDNSHVNAEFTDSGAVGETGQKPESTGGELSVSPIKDGPLMVKGNISISAGSGRVAWHGTKAALCRCGESGNKPFCDGTHKKVGFTSD